MMFMRLISNICIDAIVWVVDASDRDRLDETKKMLHQQMRDPELASKMLFVVANKQDVDGAMSPEEVEKELKLHSFDTKRTYICMGCSAKSGAGVKETIKRLAKEVKVEIKRVEKGQPVKSHAELEAKAKGKGKGKEKASSGAAADQKSRDQSHEEKSGDSKDSSDDSS